MTARTELFGPDQDWLSHTLLHAHEVVPERKTRLPDGTLICLWGTGLLQLTPPEQRCANTGEALILSAGIHGNETAPIEILNRLVNELLDSHWALACPLLLILGNPPAMVAEQRFMEVNLNRLFNGAHRQERYRGLIEAERAGRLERLCRTFAGEHYRALCQALDHAHQQPVSRSLSHYDLHTAIRPSLRERFALCLAAEGRQCSRAQQNFLLEAGISTLLLQPGTATTFSAFSTSELGAESFTFELGKVRPFGQNDLSSFATVEQALRRRMSGQEPPRIQRQGPLDSFEVVHEILNTGKHFRFFVPDQEANFTEYPPGTLIWQDDQSSYRVGTEPEAIVFPNPTVPVGQRVGLMVRRVRSPAPEPAP